MVYCETIEESKAWTCPKSGIWKVICVGGGGAGHFVVTVNTAEMYSKGVAGTATSFGSLLVADGGENGEKTVTNGGFNAVGLDNNSYNTAYGINGYNGVSCYGAACASTIGCGYGASGGVGIKSSSDKARSGAGMPGKVLSKILDISEGEVIACTIGTGGIVSENSGNVSNYGWALPGRDGAIIVQYLGLGESM